MGSRDKHDELMKERAKRISGLMGELLIAISDEKATVKGEEGKKVYSIDYRKYMGLKEICKVVAKDLIKGESKGLGKQLYDIYSDVERKVRVKDEVEERVSKKEGIEISLEEEGL